MGTLSGERAEVECHSSFTYAQEPRAFTWHGSRLEVTSVLRRWRTPAGPAFRVRVADGRTFTLFYLEREDRWDVQPT